MLKERLNLCNDKLDNLSRDISRFAENMEQNRQALDVAVCKSWKFWDQQAKQQRQRFIKLLECKDDTYDLLNTFRWLSLYAALTPRRRAVDEAYDKVNEAMKTFEKLCRMKCALDPEWPGHSTPL